MLENLFGPASFQTEIYVARNWPTLGLLYRNTILASNGVSGKKQQISCDFSTKVK
jgi:hypothetical protein